jgi:putative flavoprotein involved in K+ transport
MLDNGRSAERIETVVVGGGQAGLSVGYHLAREERSFVIVEARERVGDVWRDRWDSLRLFTPAAFSSLDGMPFPAPPFSFPTRNAMADYLEAYATRFSLPIRTGVRVERISRNGDRFLVECEDHVFDAANVVIAMADYQKPRVPPFAATLDRGIAQLHSIDYRNPDQLRDGPVLIVGAGNSGSEIAMELARQHREVWMSGRHTGHLPFRIEGRAARIILIRLVLRGLFHRVLTLDTPIGRKARGRILGKGGPLIRVKPRDLDRAGVRRVPRTTEVKDGQPVLADGRVMQISNVIWCTGFHPGFDWIDIPGFESDDPEYRRRINDRIPGLHFVGLHFLHALSSGMIHGVGRDAKAVATSIATDRVRVPGRTESTASKDGVARDLAPL